MSDEVQKGSQMTNQVESTRTAPPEPSRVPGPANRMLVLATLGFLVNFWAWALISPLGRGLPGANSTSRPSSSPCSWRCRSWSARSGASRSARSPTGSARG